MASELPSVQSPAISLVQGSQAPTQVLIQKSGNTLPQDGKVSATPSAAQPTVQSQQAKAPPTAVRQQQQELAQSQAQQAAQKAAEEKTDTAAQVDTVNKYLNTSGRAAQFKASPDNKTVQEVNPATGEVIAEYSATMFAALARSVGIAGASAVDEHA